MAWRYYLQRALTDVWLDREAQLDQVDISWVLTGPGSMNAHINAELALAEGIDGRPLFDVWSTIVYAEKDGEIRWGGVLDVINDAENGEKDLTFISFSGYPKGRIYTGEYRLYQADAFDIIRYIWSWLQSDTYGNLDVVLSSGLSGVTIGTEDPGPRPVQAEGESLTAYQQRLTSWQTLRNEPYELAWWNTPDCGSEIDSLLTEAGAEYVEVHVWADEAQMTVSHNIYMYRAGVTIQPPVDPTVAPSVTSGWDQINTGLNGHGIGGMTTSYVEDEWVIAATFDTGDPNLWWQYKLIGVNKNTGEMTRESAAFGRYESTIAGVVAYAGYFVVLHSYSRTPGTWDGWFIDYFSSNFDYIRSTFVNGLPQATAIKPALGFDYTNNRFMISWADGANSTRNAYFDLSAGGSINVAGAETLTNAFPNIGGSAIGYVGRGNFDYGAGRIIYGISGNNMFVCTPAGDRMGDAYIFRRADDAWVAGGTWDGTYLYTINNVGIISKYSPLKEGYTGPVTATYTWYDDNALGGTHETKPSPIGNGNIVRRAWNRVTTPQPPEAWNVFSNDAAKKARVYLGNTTSTRRSAFLINASPWSAALTTTDYSAGSLEPTVNTFSDLDLTSYPIGARRFDLRFVEGENIVVPPLPQRDGEAYANYVLAVGAGADRHTLREDASRIDGRLRRDAVVPLKDTYSPSLLKLTAQVYLDRVQNIMTFDTLEVFDHPNAEVGTWQLGDEIFVQTHSTSEKIASWAKVVGWSFKPDSEDIARITVLRLI